jgi:hypothetical protein
MKQSETLPLPNPGDWLTTAGTAVLLGVHRRQVERFAAAGTLTAYQPAAADTERAPVLFWRPEVEQLRDARRISRGRP